MVLACAGMANRLTQELGLPVIDGVQSGIRLLEALSRSVRRCSTAAPLAGVVDF